MSIFRRVLVPPKHSEWKRWILQATRCPKKTYELLRSVCLIQRKAELPWLPKDVWNIIMIEVCSVDEIDSKKWKDNSVYWFEEWVENQMQQQNIPIPLITAKEAGAKMTYLAGLHTLIEPPQKDCVIEIVPAGPWLSSSCTVSRAGDIALGFQIQDISNISSLSLEIGGQSLAPFIFTSDYERSSLSLNGETVHWYFHPHIKAIPLIALAFHEVRLNIRLNDDTKDIPEIGILHAFLNGVFRSKFYQMGHILNRNEPDKTIIISSGMLGYISEEGKVNSELYKSILAKENGTYQEPGEQVHVNNRPTEETLEQLKGMKIQLY